LKSSGGPTAYESIKAPENEPSKHVKFIEPIEIQRNPSDIL